jgi:hypothetical protein
MFAFYGFMLSTSYSIVFPFLLYYFFTYYVCVVYALCIGLYLGCFNLLCFSLCLGRTTATGCRPNCSKNNNNNNNNNNKAVPVLN